MKLTKKEKEIYNWLCEKHGYIKKGIEAGWGWCPIQCSFKQYKRAVEEARAVLPQYYNKPNLISKRKPTKGLINMGGISSGRSLIAPKNRGSSTLGVIEYDPNNVLAIADTHFPFVRKGYLEHCLNIRDKYRCGTVVMIGDEVDNCAISQWEKDPDGFSAGTEAELAQVMMREWYKAFPNVKVCIGNHTSRPFRLARANGMPKKFLKSYEEAWEAPRGWEWSEHYEIDGVLYTHGTGMSGASAAIKLATRYRQNVVIGHIHSEAGIQYNASKIDLIWGMQLGGALDDNTYAAYYAKDQLKKSIVGCGVVIGGELPIYEPMKL